MFDCSDFTPVSAGRLKGFLASGILALSLGGFAASPARATNTSTLATPAAKAPSSDSQLSNAAERLLDGVAAKAGGAPSTYRAERNRALETLNADDGLRTEILAAAKTKVSADNFSRLMIVRILAERLQNDDADAQLDGLKGLTASHYLKRRRPRAGAVNELKRRAVPAPLLYERLAFTRDQALAQTTAPDAFPPEHAKAAAEWIAKEEAGHIEALVHALGESGDAIAPYALERHLAGAKGTDEATTLLALGKTRAAHLLPVFLRSVDGKNADAQQTAIVAIGHLRTKAGTQALAEFTRHPDASIRLAAIRALGIAASVRTKDEGQEERLDIALAALVPLLDVTTLAKREGDAVVQTLSQLPSTKTRAMVSALASPRGEIVLRRLDRKARRSRR